MDMKEFQTALRAVRKGGLILKKHFGRVGYRLKGRANPVTIADLEAQAAVIKTIKKRFPSDSFLAEENLHDFKSADRSSFAPALRAGALKGRGPAKLMLSEADRLWILDPLDGTLNYAHSFPHFSVSLAFCIKGEPALGVIYDPSREELFTAEKGKGAFLNGKRISVSKTAKIKDSLLATGFAYDRGEKADYYCSYYAAFLKISHDIRRAGSASLDLAWTACGRLDGYWEFNLKPWDVAAGLLIAGEAGGKVTDFSGKPFGPGTDSVKKWGTQTLCSNSRIHTAMLKVIRKRLGNR